MNRVFVSIRGNLADYWERHGGRITRVVIWGLLLLAVALRTAQYLAAREFWFDEACLAVDTMNASYRDLFGPLPYNRVSPIAFLIGVKTLTVLFGTGEYAFRLLPFVSSILSVVLFFALARRVATVNAAQGGSALKTAVRWDIVVIALAFFAVSKHAIYYASELRHYSTDLFFTCLLCWLALPKGPDAALGEIGNARFATLAVFGVIAPWFSVASVFVLAAIGTVSFVAQAAKKDWRQAARVGGMGLAWVASFCFHLRILDANTAAQGSTDTLKWACEYLSVPFPPTSLGDLKSCRDAFERVFYFPCGLTYTGLGAFAFLAGCVALWRSRRSFLFVTVLALFFTAAASGLHRYPFRNQYLLFMLPCLLLAIAGGIGLLLHRATCGTPLVGVVLLVMLLTQPFVHGLAVLAEPRTGPGGPYAIKPLLEIAKAQWQEGDVLYACGEEFVTFYYYGSRCGFEKTDAPLSPALYPLKGKGEAYVLTGARGGDYAEASRFWLLIPGDELPPTVAASLEKAGVLRREREVFHSPGATLYSYPLPAG